MCRYDLHGSNFHIPLREELRAASSGEALSSSDADDVAPLLPLDRIPQLPQVCSVHALTGEGVLSLCGTAAII